MSNLNIINLKGGNMGKANIKLPSINCRECAENSLSEALSAGVIEALMADATQLAESEFEQRLIIERDKFKKKLELKRCTA